MSSNGSERHPSTSHDVEAFFAELVLNDYDGVSLESVGRPLPKFDAMTDPNPARQERLYAAAHENAAVSAGQLPPR
ncbi:MAG TPA: hypothetical protein VNG32_04925 [Candidatus Dormibacteraeota bacterium]|nr:hypothetical protein [Candidatus Dormibacteraeota bacterium]